MGNEGTVSGAGLTVVNFGHPLTSEQQVQVAELTGTSVARVIDVPTHLDEERPFAGQVAALVAAAGLSPVEWQTLPLLINLPSYAPIAALLLAHLHGLCGHFPAALRLRPVAGSTPLRFEVAEVLSLRDIRADARPGRYHLEEAV